MTDKASSGCAGTARAARWLSRGCAGSRMAGTSTPQQSPWGRRRWERNKGVTFTLTAEALVRRLVALVPPPRRHLTSFHGVYAPHAALRPVVTQPVESPPAQVATPSAPTVKKRKRHLDWATLHQRTWGTDVLRCPCGGRRSIRSLHSTRKQAEARLLELGVALPSRLLPPATAPPQLSLAV